RGYGREHELEADRLGAEYLAKSGYDPDAILEVIGVLKNQELFELRLAREEGRQPRIYHGVFSTHPDS
ncbi:MAG: M48 family metalloprotease, partial [Gammaproteobacteria bacterium]|nr:M48 family metalloprotease [Gammaproteobacteria bacterium]NIO62422.1 M48 family metalloprotease [Gammaproteobacteria bacterium]